MPLSQEQNINRMMQTVSAREIRREKFFENLVREGFQEEVAQASNTCGKKHLPK